MCILYRGCFLCRRLLRSRFLHRWGFLDRFRFRSRCFFLCRSRYFCRRGLLGGNCFLCRGSGIAVHSRGTSVLFSEPVNEKAVRILADHGLRPARAETKLLESKDISETTLILTSDESVKRKIVRDGSDPKYGARPLRRTIQNEIEDPLADAILSGKVREDMTVSAGVKNDKVIFEGK